MNHDDMARELRAAGWTNTADDVWWDPVTRSWCYETRLAHSWMAGRKELAQQRERGTVQTPVVGTEEKR